MPEFKVAPEYVPEAYGYHSEQALIVMQYISPHIILRRGMMDGIGMTLMLNTYLLRHFLLLCLLCEKKLFWQF